ncbi:phosphotransferase family protein [Haloarcula onubensis]|uniref:Phosphotransferase n=1 Tax=Haloarcula onubensis TaxID=2950539 RepID=A0ABU2FSG4_9EURY|nr:phosphotransferase [Halomicroarcula sp. S3CR25-11]MDS0283707.1 phosphotransferase [Halomicroarcula sp. S3CR25-11]
MDTALASAVVGTHFPGRAVASVDPLSAGKRPTAVVRFRAHPAVVVQFSADGERVRTEAALVAAVRERTTVPAPAVLATGTREGRGYAVSEYRRGADLHTSFADSAPPVRRSLAEQFGRYLGELHAAFPFEGCGRLVRAPDGDPNALVASAPDCHRWLVSYGRRAVDRLPAAFDPLRDRLRDCLDAAAPAAPTPRLFPWDLRPGNALAADGAVRAVVDWERPMTAPPALALAKLAYLVADWYVPEPAPLRRAVRRGYEAVRPVPTVAPVHRVVAVADSAVDSRATVTNPGYPPRERDAAVAFHRASLSAALPD